ncbi:hypothetical protein GCM10023331_20500 [Algivirga pacifica]|uniref:Formylglycine-generating enzyme, required for sulfatase activity, contains SUMF1/FGE domain n=1 Tax=Algivirga pacifica TaxID=1162670 RepID=A0ABP9DDR2_9BACT
MAQATPEIIEGKKYALVMGNNIYDHENAWPKLNNAVNDAQDVAAALQQFHGFEVTFLQNSTKKNFLDAFRSISDKVQKNDRFLLFVAGHGDFDPDLTKDGYLVFKDSQDPKVDSYRGTYVDYTLLNSILDNLSCDHVGVILDVCFGGVFNESLRKSSSRGQNNMYNRIAPETYAKMMLGYRTRKVLTSGADEPVTDGVGRNSPFTSRVLKSLTSTEKLVSMERIFQTVRSETGKGLLNPFGSNKVGSDFIFRYKLEGILADTNPLGNNEMDPKDHALTLVQGGFFKMGGTEYDAQPIREVKVDDFYISKHEVTVAQFEEFVLATNYITDAEKAGNSENWRHDPRGMERLKSDYNQPVIYVSWNDAVAYCNWLRESTGDFFRLPTEAEWEYAAKGGSSSKRYTFAGGNSAFDVMWFDQNADNNIHAIAKKTPNELDLYDMSGNVYEWCADYYGPYHNDDTDNPKGPEAGTDRVTRGGSWRDYEENGSPSYRNSFSQGEGADDIGFRVVRATYE